MSTVLAIDTTSATIALAFAVNGEIAGSMAVEGGQDHSQLLLRSIEELLGPKKQDLTGIVVVRGPGSYAGLRVGIATAQGLGLARGIPVRGVPTMDAIAAASGLRDFTAIHPAGRGEYAAQEFRGGEPARPLHSTRAEELRGQTLAGEGAGALGGTEVDAERRCRAALELMLPRLARETPGETEAIYLREPNITISRRSPAAH